MSTFFRLSQSIKGGRISDVPDIYEDRNIITIEKVIHKIFDREILKTCIMYYFLLRDQYNVPTQEFLSNYNLSQLRTILCGMLEECSSEDQLFRISFDDVGHGKHGKMCRKIVSLCRGI
tara:strand:- start:1123 stop:1479 length:357 start_codon:yes stop_codon:yes gene_type:complete